MIAWINLAVLVLSTLLTLVFYVKSVGPAALERKIGPDAYRKCARYRLTASAFMTLASINYVVYFFFPLPLPLPASFPWPWWVSALIAVAVAIPSGYLWYRGLRDAGLETMFPREEHTLYGGIYENIRHPQALGELPFWWVLAFALHSPFLVLYSVIWIPIFLLMVLAEEQDLHIRYGQAYEEYRQRTGFLIPRRKR
jgi:protein-S-isoprenylcysteine O-methyltransferase Ste14